MCLNSARRLLVTSLLAISFAFPSLASAEVLDRIEIERGGNGEREIVLWFLRDVSYLRSSPTSEGQAVRIYLQFLPQTEPSPMREVLHGAARDSVPSFVITFPELDGSVSVVFRDSVRFRVAQLRGPRSVSVLIKDRP
jgi:hypothetical protein